MKSIIDENINEQINVSIDSYQSNTNSDCIQTDYNLTNDINRSNNMIYYELYSFDMVKYYGNSQKFRAMLMDIYGTPISGETITFTVNGVNYNRITNVNGIAELAINLGSGNYTIISKFHDSQYNNLYQKSNLITILSTIEGNDIIKYYKNGTQYYATFYDTSGNLLINTNVTFNINGVIYTRSTDNQGVAKLNINLYPGSYIITANNPCNNELHSNNITVLSTMTTHDLIMNYGDGSQFKVYLVDGQGNPYANQIITFNINGVIYQRTTNSNGVASLNINLAPGNYIVTSSHDGLLISNNIIVN